MTIFPWLFFILYPGTTSFGELGFCAGKTEVPKKKNTQSKERLDPNRVPHWNQMQIILMRGESCHNCPSPPKHTESKQSILNTYSGQTVLWFKFFSEIHGVVYQSKACTSTTTKSCFKTKAENYICCSFIHLGQLLTDFCFWNIWSSRVKNIHHLRRKLNVQVILGKQKHARGSLKNPATWMCPTIKMVVVKRVPGIKRAL